MASSILAIQVPESLQPFLYPYVEKLIGSACADPLVYEPLGQWSKFCIKLAFSKVLGMGIVVAGSIVKLPQIIKVLNAKSTQGLSPMAHWMETVASSIFVRYNTLIQTPFSTYGEASFIVLQNFILLACMAKYNQKSMVGLVSLIVLFLAALAKLPDLWIISLQSITIPLGLISKIPAILTILKQKHTGTLSAMTVFAYFAGSLARIFTTLQEVNDRLILLSFGLNGILNGVLLFLIIWYWKATNQILSQKKKTKKE
jgi:mannose-P-dolichol utilization defect protein 1